MLQTKTGDQDKLVLVTGGACLDITKLRRIGTIRAGTVQDFQSGPACIPNNIPQLVEFTICGVDPATASLVWGTAEHGPNVKARRHDASDAGLWLALPAL